MEKWNELDVEVILASGSPRRKQLLSQMGVEFRVEVDSIEDEEQFFRNEGYLQAIEKLAHAKAAGVAKKNPCALVLGADTIVVSDNRVLGKPKDRQDALGMLKSYSGKSHSVFTSVSAECIKTGFQAVLTAETKVNFRELDEWEIDSYLNVAHYQDKAGAYGIQDEAMMFVESLSGCYTNVVGFPVSSVIELLKKFKKDQNGVNNE